MVLYNRKVNQVRAIGLALELYNSNNDPNLETPLASTNEIASGVNVYRFDFPAIDTYPSGSLYLITMNNFIMIKSKTL